MHRPDFWAKVGSRFEWSATNDGKFEQWMDEHDPNWHYSNTDTMEFCREIWEAAHAEYEKK